MTSDVMHATRLEISGDELELTLEARSVATTVTVTVSDGGLSEHPDFLLPATLLPAMKAGLGLSLPSGVSPRLLAGSDEVQNIASLCSDDYRRIPIDAVPRDPERSTATSTACFFSGGVDTWSTTLKFLDEIDVLVFMDGVFHRPGWDAVTENAHAAARELGKPLLSVTTDLKRLANFAYARVPFPDYGGNLVAAIALLLQHRFNRVLVAGSFSYAALPMRAGSHPLVDPLWSTEALEIVHDGAELTRSMKVARLAESDIAMRRLHVCSRAGPGSKAEDVPGLNCGRCGKCLRTMINLRAVGALSRCETLPDELDLELVEQLPMKDDRDLAFAMDHLRTLEPGHDPELEAAVRTSLSRAEIGEIGISDYLSMKQRLADCEKQNRMYRESLGFRVSALLHKLALRRTGRRS